MKKLKPLTQLKQIRDLTPWQVLLRSALICVIFSIVFLGLALERIERLPINGDPLNFDSQKAFETTRYLSKQFPYRLPWHENKAKAFHWLKKQFSDLGYQPKEMVFSEVIAGKEYNDLRNLYVEKKGSTHPDEIIAMVAHYDTAETTIEGALDDASGVGVVLELARIFAKENPNRTLLFLLTDSEEFGAFWGAKTFVKSYPKSRQIIATANFDFIAPEKQVSILTLSDGLKMGYTPLWLRELAMNSIRSVPGVAATDFINVVEFIQRAMLIPAADHGPFLAAGIPAFNWVGQSENFAYQMAHYHHTPFDVMEALQPESFRTYGQSAERLVRSVDGLTILPENFRNSSYLKISPNLFIQGWCVTIIQILAFIPFFLYSFTKFKLIFIREEKPLIQKVFRNELKNIGIVLAAALFGYALLRLLPAFNIIAEYEAFPATQKSAILYSPNLIAIALVLLTGVIVYWVLKKTFWEKEDTEEYLDIRHAFHAIFLTIIIILAFAANGYLATLLLLPPAYLWTALRKNRSTRDRIMNGLLLIGGFTTLAILAIVMGTIFHIGVVYWYLFLAAAYGLISVYTVVIFIMVMTVVFRLFKKFVTE